ncbi:rCG24436 [Rattus norvegicus]|uniref:RCG24436 n=1 Tax=Rattus norvegicus TaxID=10116 RepID=A6K5D5_RAT|nr:rCG24436 [Rattus norvegicus]
MLVSTEGELLYTSDFQEC